ncbi:MAG: hypothetical protein FWE07_08490 [Turicibacter sp.]|nr:hypothetical protein [Turicibacter sp.]
MRDAMKEQEVSKIDFKLRYKSAFIFFLLTFLCNIMFNPILMGAGMSGQWSAFLVNSFGVTAAASYVYLVINKKYQSKKQAALTVLAIGAVVTILCYNFVFNV